MFAHGIVIELTALLVLGRLCLAELDQPSNLLNEFTFEVVPCLILDNFLEVCINFDPALQGGGWVGPWEGGKGGEGCKNPQVKPEDTGPPVALRWSCMTTQLHRRDTIPVEGRIPDWLHPNGALHRCQCVRHGLQVQSCKSTPQKSRPIESGHGRHAVQVANVCSYI